jgi:hypothetical protein
MDGKLAQFLVEASLPKGVSCAPENFAGDAGVQAFLDGVRRGQPDLNMEVWVHWRGPPDVSILRCSGRNIIVRSERFDVLLIEYHNLFQFVTALSQPAVADCMIRSAVSKWFAEFLLGFRAPRLALLSHQRYRATQPRFVHHTFRDEAFASVPEMQKAALQCFSLAHEIAHIVYPRRRGMTLDFVSDGIDLRSHLTWELRQMSIEPEIIDALISDMVARIDADVLVTEIDADVSALGTIAAYLTKTFKVSRGDALQAALMALQAQGFLNHCKNTCRLLCRHLRDRLDSHEFAMSDWIEGQYIMARTRAALRRATMLWYMWDEEDGIIREPDFYRAAVDSLLVNVQTILAKLSKAAFDEAEQLYQEANVIGHDTVDQDLLQCEIDDHLRNPDDRLSIFYILISMGYSGEILSSLKELLFDMERSRAMA